MNFLRNQLSFGNLLDQRHRGMCNKPQEVKPESSAPVSAQNEPRPSHKVPGYRPSDWDKKIFLWSGRFKSVDQIPETVSFEMIDSARNKLRVKAAYLMIAATLAACGVMVFLGKRASGRNETLTAYNMEKKAKWREELRKENSVALSEKAQ
uniref:Family with sequence similarity 162 member A n=1 Tax=Oryzias latipes TaxID=8090 RepID=A0A3P9M8M1_ORYLA